MSRAGRIRTWAASMAPFVIALVSASAAAAHTTPSAGGSGYEEPDVSALKCGTGDRGACPRGDVLRLSGEGLARTRSVTFLGGPGRQDDRVARPQERSPHRVLVAVPGGASSGPLEVVTPTAATTAPRLRVLAAAAAKAPTPPPAPATAAPGADGGVFPIVGAHDYGTGVNRFGGGRGHQGQDVFAKCETPLVSALGGVVVIGKFQERAGNYVVIKADDGTSQAYMHMAAAASVKKGQRVTAGQAIGQVGDTGRADGCHLHFELWDGGWQTDGTAIDPLPALQRWDAAG